MVYVSNLMGKIRRWEETSMERTGFLEGSMGDKKGCDAAYPCRCGWNFHLLHGHKTPPERESMVGVDVSPSWE